MTIARDTFVAFVDTLAEVLDVDQCRILLRDDRTRSFAEVYPQAEGGVLPEEVQPAIEMLAEPVLVGEIEVRRRTEGRQLRQMGVEMLLPLWLRTWQALGTPQFQFKVAR